jgi:hypothetical protein
VASFLFPLFGFAPLGNFTFFWAGRIFIGLKEVRVRVSVRVGKKEPQ